MTDIPAGIGDNSGDLAELIGAAYSPIRLADDHEALGRQVQDLGARLVALTAVDTAEQNEAAGALVIEARALATKIDTTCDEVKEPVFRAYERTLAFFNGLNRNDPKRPGQITAGKLRLERLISGYAFRVAEAARLAREAAAKVERERAAAEALAAAEAEAANRPAVAQVLIEEAVKSEAIATKHDEVAQGPVQELARTRTGSSTTGLRAAPGFDVDDWTALRGSLGVLGGAITADAITAAVRKYRADSETVAKWAFRDNDQDAQKRVVVPPMPVPGVTYFTEYLGMVRN